MGLTLASEAGFLASAQGIVSSEAARRPGPARLAAAARGLRPAGRGRGRLPGSRRDHRPRAGHLSRTAPQQPRTRPHAPGRDPGPGNTRRDGDRPRHDPRRAQGRGGHETWPPVLISTTTKLRAWCTVVGPAGGLRPGGSLVLGEPGAAAGGSGCRERIMAAGLGSTWWQYLLLFLGVAASWAGVPVIGTAALGAAAVAASQGRLPRLDVVGGRQRLWGEPARHGPPHRARYRHLGHRGWRRAARRLRRCPPSPKAHAPASWHPRQRVARCPLVTR